MDKHFSMNWVVEEKEQTLLREFLKRKNISKRSLTSIKHDGGLIQVNEEEATVRKKLTVGDEVKIIFPPEERSSSLKSEKISLDIIFEDDALLVINKPPFMNTIPSREHPSESIANAILGRYDERGYKGAVHIATRLDRNTSGLMLIAKHTHAHHIISQQQQAGKVNRVYIAAVHGRVEEESGVIEQPIGRKDTSIIEREVRSDGQYAITYYQLKEKTIDSSLIELRLGTGRTHQIRVHMQSIGHPIIGDDLYGGKRDKIK